MSKITLVDKYIKLFFNIQLTIYQNIKNVQNNHKLMINTEIYHYLMLINKDLKTLAYCRKVLLKDNFMDIADKDALSNQIRDSIYRLRRYQTRLTDLFY